MSYAPAYRTPWSPARPQQAPRVLPVSDEAAAPAEDAQDTAPAWRPQRADLR